MTLFGINGVRGTANRDLTPEVALKIGKVVGRAYGKRIAIATDARDSADMLKSALSAGIMSSGSDIVDLGIMPTPTLQYYVRTHPDVTGGVVITASHNPPEHNGFKFIKDNGVEATREDEMSIGSSVAGEVQSVPWAEIGREGEDSGAILAHVKAVIDHIDAEAVRSANLTVCVDCANGATCEATPLLLKLLNVRAFTINADPQSESPGHSSEPTEENGDYVIGDISLALIAKSVLSEQKGKVITPVSSSAIVEDVVEANGGLLKYTAVGSHEVVRKMEENVAVFGGEENGGLVFPGLQMCRDGIMALAKMLECVAKNGPLSEQIATLETYHDVKCSVPCPDDMKSKLLDRFSEGTDSRRTETVDGLKIYFDDGWVLLRPSTTEDLFRIYSESKDPDVAAQRAESYAEIAREFLSGGSGQ